MAGSGERDKVKVVDRRWFTAEGELREGAPEAVSGTQAPDSPPAPEPTPAPAPAREPEAPAAEREAPSIVQSQETPAPAERQAPEGEPHALPAGPGIADIVDLLAQQAMAFLSGQVPGRGRDPATARYFIDMLGVLKEKTTGRLTLEETNFLDDVLYQLRSLYVAATR